MLLKPEAWPMEMQPSQLPCRQLEGQGWLRFTADDLEGL